MTHLLSKPKIAVGVAAALVLSFLAFMLALSGQPAAIADHQPADKVAASGSTMEILQPSPDPDDEEAEDSRVVTLLSTSLRTSTPSDLMFSVTAECSITTTLKTEGNDEAGAEGVVEVWVEIDGERVGVNNTSTSTTTGKAEDDGEVVFCNQANQRETMFGDDEDATIETFLRTKQANGFNWVALNVGNEVKQIDVKARLTATATNEATAEAVVGRRTLVVEPTKLPHDAGV